MSTAKQLKDQYNDELVALALRYGSSRKPHWINQNKHPRSAAFQRKLKRVFPRGSKARKFLFQ